MEALFPCIQLSDYDLKGAMDFVDLIEVDRYKCEFLDTFSDVRTV